MPGAILRHYGGGLLIDHAPSTFGFSALRTASRLLQGPKNRLRDIVQRWNEKEKSYSYQGAGQHSYRKTDFSSDSDDKRRQQQCQKQSFCLFVICLFCRIDPFDRSQINFPNLHPLQIGRHCLSPPHYDKPFDVFG